MTGGHEEFIETLKAKIFEGGIRSFVVIGVDGSGRPSLGQSIMWCEDVLQLLGALEIARTNLMERFERAEGGKEWEPEEEN